MGPADLQRDVAEIQTLLTERLRIRGRTLDAQLRKAGRLLPRRIRTEARYLAQAMALVQNPKLARMIDTKRVDRAHSQVVAHLRSIDPVAQRTDRILRTLALWSLYLFLSAGAVLAYAHWQGLV